jgi:hypothetical protein
LTLKASTGRAKKFGSAAEIPVGIFGAHMAEIHSQVGKKFLHVSSFAMPEGQSLHRE